MKRYVKASLEDEFNSSMLRPLIKECVQDALDFHNENKEFDDDLPDYNSIVDFAAQHVQAYFEDMTYEDYADLVKKYIDTELTDVEMI